MKRLIPLAALALFAGPSPAAEGAPFTIAETGRGYARLADAVRAVGDGEATILIAPGTYRDCAVQVAGVITFRAIQQSTAIFDGGTCEGKAALVLRGRGARVEGLVFQNMRVPDGNGAGIRLEEANLVVSHTIFRNSQEGILTAADENGALHVDQSTFSGLGRCDGDLACAHSIYVGYYGSLTVTRSRFERGRGGHYVKSNATRSEIRDSSFDDTQGQATNYMIDLPAGATGIVTGNTFVQGANKENYSAMIVVAAEARNHPSAGLSITGNDARLGSGARGTSFVVDFSHERLAIGANRLGPGIKAFEVR